MSSLLRAVTDMEQSNSRKFDGRDRRREPRYSVHETVDIFAGNSETLLGIGVMLDVSRSGACIQMPTRLALGAIIRIVTSTNTLRAIVRHCGAAFTGCIIGVELTENSVPEATGWTTLPAAW